MSIVISFMKHQIIKKQKRMKNIGYTILLILVVMILPQVSSAQLDSTMNKCRSKMVMPFVTDGQTYTALINGDEVAEFHSTFYGENTYRIVGYSGKEEGNLIFSIYDRDRNLLFSNIDYNNAPYWDLEFDYSMDCIIEARLDSKNITSGFAVLLIGFQQ